MDTVKKAMIEFSVTIKGKLLLKKVRIKMTSMWQEERGKHFYRFQTDNKEISNKMKRRNKFKLVGYGYNCTLWIYQAVISRPDIARNILKTLSGGIVKFNEKEDLFYSECISLSEDKIAS